MTDLVVSSGILDIVELPSDHFVRLGLGLGLLMVGCIAAQIPAAVLQTSMKGETLAQLHALSIRGLRACYPEDAGEKAPPSTVRIGHAGGLGPLHMVTTMASDAISAFLRLKRNYVVWMGRKLPRQLYPCRKLAAKVLTGRLNMIFDVRGRALVSVPRSFRQASDSAETRLSGQAFAPCAMLGIAQAGQEAVQLVLSRHGVKPQVTRFIVRSTL